MKYFLWLTYKDHAQEYLDEYEEFDTLEKALECVNHCSEKYTFRLVEGRDIELKPVETVTRYVVK
jgi:hypothetical protein